MRVLSELERARVNSELGLPKPGHRHWRPRNKATVLLALDMEILAPETAARDYSLTARELNEWRRDRSVAGAVRALEDELGLPNAET